MAFPRPTSERELVLIDVDPRQIHAFWTLPIGAVAAARAQPGGAGPDAPMVLRLSEIGDDGALGAFVDVEVVGLQAQSYVEVESACRRYRAELGLRRPDGVLVAIVASNDVVLPPTGPALPVEPEATKPEPIKPAPVRVEAGRGRPGLGAVLHRTGAGKTETRHAGAAGCRCAGSSGSAPGAAGPCR